MRPQRPLSVIWGQATARYAGSKASIGLDHHVRATASVTDCNKITLPEIGSAERRTRLQSVTPKVTQRSDQELSVS